MKRALQEVNAGGVGSVPASPEGGEDGAKEEGAPLTPARPEMRLIRGKREKLTTIDPRVMHLEIEGAFVAPHHLTGLQMSVTKTPEREEFNVTMVFDGTESRFRIAKATDSTEWKPEIGTLAIFPEYYYARRPHYNMDELARDISKTVKVHSAEQILGNILFYCYRADIAAVDLPDSKRDYKIFGYPVFSKDGDKSSEYSPGSSHPSAEESSESPESRQSQSSSDEEGASDSNDEQDYEDDEDDADDESDDDKGKDDDVQGDSSPRL